MPIKPARPCRRPGCPNLTDDKTGYCSTHKKQEAAAIDARRGTSTERGYDSHWAKVRHFYLSRHPLCVDCLANNRVHAAEEVHHIKALADGGTHDDDNLMSLCKAHHSARTIMEQGMNRP